MGTPSIATAFYAPSEPPADAEQMRYWIKDELLKVGAVLQLLAAGHIETTTVAPTKPREGDIRLANGTTWKPNGTGAAGVWAFYAGSWKLLG